MAERLSDTTARRIGKGKVTVYYKSGYSKTYTGIVDPVAYVRSLKNDPKIKDTRIEK